jgi:methionyl-tRNA formyltransferase
MNIVFFGSFQHYSALILQSLIDSKNIHVTGVVTTPPMPVGRKQIITKTPVHTLAEKYNIPVFTPKNLHQPLQTFTNLDEPPDFFLIAGYGKILPESWLNYPKFGSLNLHFSLLPKYRGANPTEWAIMCGETNTGITLINMTSKLDGGDILAQAEIPITPTDTRETLYQKLYELGAKFLPQWLQSPLAPPKSQGKAETPYAALLKRNDGFLPWSTIQKYLKKQDLEPSDFTSKHLQKAFEYSATDTKHFIRRLPRALTGYPSLWTIIPTSKGDKRMKILNFTPFTVQVEGKQPSLFNQVKNQIL